MSRILKPDPEGMNEARADAAGDALEAFRNVMRCDREDALRDLLADLHHWADRNGTDFNKELLASDDHYRAETGAGGPLADAGDIYTLGCETHRKFIVEAAKMQNHSDNLQIDDDADTAEGDENGCFVSAWIWQSFDGLLSDKNQLPSGGE